MITRHTRVFALSAAALAALLALAPAASAAEMMTNTVVNAGDETTGVHVTATAADEGAGAHMSATGTAMTGADESGTHMSTSSRAGEARGSANMSETGSQHMSTVAAQVQLLLQAANRDGGIGDEVRAIAKEVASTSQSSEEAKTKVEARPGWLTFLIGSDYGNLGKLRSNMVTTQNQITRLTQARDRTTNASAKAELDTEIQTLQASASTTNAFVQQHESSFSLFGWAARLFAS